MSSSVVQKRNEIPIQYTWNSPSVFSSNEAWDTEANRLQQTIPSLQKYKSRLAEGPAVLLEAFNQYQEILEQTGKVLVYALLTAAVNTADPMGAQMQGKAWGLLGQFQAAVSYFEPELLAIGLPKLSGWMDGEKGLAIYAHYFEDLFRKQKHVRSAEVEEILGMLVDPFNSTSTTVSLMTDADFRFPPAKSKSGEEHPVTQGSLQGLLSNPDREVRRTAWEGYRDTYLAYKNTLANNLATSIKQEVFRARARHYSSSLEAKLSENNIPTEVFYNLIDTFKRNLPLWHRYWAVRRKALKVDQLQSYDVWAPLTAQSPVVPYSQAVDWVCSAVAPLGKDYVQAVRKGCLEDRWIDVYPSQGKSSSQFSAGWYGTYPFIFLNYDDTIFSASTVAHELGHSMHSYLTWKNQPQVYSDYSLFVAETASNFHQALLRGYLLANNPDPAFQISVIEEAMDNFHRYFFIMPTLARFELEMHERVERGEGLTAELMNNRMADLFAEGHGDEMFLDRERVGITWATFSHLYSDYYVYQYATGISAANALSRRILSGDQDAAGRYLNFLKAGNSLYPLDALKLAGIDMTTPQPVEEAFQVLSGLVDRLEKLVQ